MMVNLRSEPGGWILPKCARMIRDADPAEIRWEQGGDEMWAHPDIEHGVNFGYVRMNAGGGTLCTAQFNHYNPRVGGELFRDRARQVHHCVAISEGAELDLLTAARVPAEKITRISLGVDPTYEPRLVLGVVGRAYEERTQGQDTRKGRELLRRIVGHPVVRDHCFIRIMGEGWGTFNDVAHVELVRFDLRRLPYFYSTLDYLLCTSTLEGGPVPMLEGLACGIQMVMPRIGYAYTHPHVEYQAGDAADLVRTLERLVGERQSDYEVGQNRAAVAGMTWAAWGMFHVKLFKRLLERPR